MIDYENLFNIQILPDHARNDSDISLLTLEEHEQDLTDTGKFNKKNAELLRKEFQLLNRFKSQSGQECQLSTKTVDQEESKEGG